MSPRDPGPRSARPEAVPRADDAAVRPSDSTHEADGRTSARAEEVDARPAARERPSARVRLAACLRAAVALLVLAALVWSTVQAVGDGVLAQHVSYFTNQSNLLFALLLVASVSLPRRRRPRWWDDVRGAATFYLMMTGIIYALLVAPLDELLRWDIGWTGIVLHRLAPIAALLDWLLAPRRRRPSAWRLLGWLAYPITYLVLTWVRGGVTGWYPYAFLDPTVSSWPQVLATTAVVLLAFLVIAAAVHLLQGRLPQGGVPQSRLPQGRVHRNEVPGRDPGPDLR